VIVAAAIYAEYRCCYLPAVCNRVEKEAQATTIRALDLGSYRSASIARVTIDRLNRCAESWPTDVGGLMILAANQQILGRPDQAAQTYQSALIYDKRPELYLNLGLALAQAGRRDEARTALIRAAVFAPAMADEIPDAQLKSEVQSAVAARDAQIRGMRP